MEITVDNIYFISKLMEEVVGKQNVRAGMLWPKSGEYRRENPGWSYDDPREAYFKVGDQFVIKDFEIKEAS